MKKLLRVFLLSLALLLFVFFSKAPAFATTAPFCGICPAGTMRVGQTPIYDYGGGVCNLVGAGGTFCSYSGSLCTDPVPTIPNCTGITINPIPNSTAIGTFTYATGSFTDLYPSVYSATVDYGDGTGAQALILSGNNFSLSHTYLNSGIYSVTVTVSDTVGMPASTTFLVNVTVNTPPTVGVITVNNATAAVNTAITAFATFTDTGTSDTHTAVWNWGDTTTSAGTVSETNGSGWVTDSHTYTAPGVYTITLTVTDNNNASASSAYQYISVYDPSGSFLTGSGTFPSALGDLKFGVHAKYVNNSLLPKGETELDLKKGNFEFETTGYQWLVIFGNVAYLQGTGKVNDAGNYNILLTAVDGTPTGTPDLIRIQITDPLTNNVVFDNEQGAPLYALPTTQITRGSIKIH